MDLSPTKKHRTLSRQPSSPSLAVGLPPPLPDHHHHHSNIMGTPSTNTRSATKKNRKKQPSRRGDVSSSAASSPSVTDDEWVMPTTPGPGLSTHAHPSASSSNLSSSILATDDEDDAGATEITPKRKVIATLEGSKTQPKPAKREGLQARLQAAAAAKLKTSKSHGQGLVASASISQLVPKVKPETITASASGLLHGGAGPSSGSGGSDKVIVCVR
jgi:centromeric protein E